MKLHFDCWCSHHYYSAISASCVVCTQKDLLPRILATAYEKANLRFGHEYILKELKSPIESADLLASVFSFWFASEWLNILPYSSSGQSINDLMADIPKNR